MESNDFSGPDFLPLESEKELTGMGLCGGGEKYLPTMTRAGRGDRAGISGRD